MAENFENPDISSDPIDPLQQQVNELHEIVKMHMFSTNNPHHTDAEQIGAVHIATYRKLLAVQIDTVIQRIRLLSHVMMLVALAFGVVITYGLLTKAFSAWPLMALFLSVVYVALRILRIFVREHSGLAALSREVSPVVVPAPTSELSA